MKEDKLITINSDHMKTAKITGTIEENLKIQNDSLKLDHEIGVIYLLEHSLEDVKISVSTFLERTSHLNPFLILLNNGGGQEITDYLTNISYASKKIYHITKKTDIFHLYPILEDIQQSKFLVTTSSAVIVTKNWLEHLLLCLESDETICVAVPLTINGNNAKDPKEDEYSTDFMNHLNKRTEEFNQISRPDCWEERKILESEIACYRSTNFNSYAKCPDGFFYDYCKIARSLRIARTGRKQVLCTDTLVYLKKYPPSYEKEIHDSGMVQSLKNFKEFFWGLHPLDDLNNHEETLIALGAFRVNSPNVLGVEIRCGAPFYEYQYQLKKKQKCMGEFSAFITEPKYYHDLLHLCDGRVVHDRMNFLLSRYETGNFDVIIFGEPINRCIYPDTDYLLTQLLKLLKNCGEFYFKIVLTETYISNKYQQMNFASLLALLNVLGVKEKKVIAAFEEGEGLFYVWVKK